MFKKSMVFMIIFALIMSFAFPINAATSDEASDDYNEYLSYFEQGILGEDVTFEVWKSLRDASYELEAALEASHEFSMVYSSRSSSYSSYSMRAGDVFITNGTSVAGITGHAAIAISSTEILHISGPGANPTTISLSEWHNQYTNRRGSDTWTKIYRHSNSTIASEAAEWAEDTYKGSSAAYHISDDVHDTNLTYCSKLVWQAYVFGPDNTDAAYISFGYILPYSLDGLIGDVSLIKTYVGTD